MKTAIRLLLVAFAVLLALFLADRLYFNPRPLSSVGKVALFLVAGGTVLWAASLAALHTRFAGTVGNFWLVAVSSLLAYLAVDIAGGIAFIRPLSPAIEPDGQLHHRLQPGKASYIETTEYAYLQRVNALGLRGPEIVVPKAPGTFRILMLGDSFTMGKGVADSETFSRLLESSLNRRTPGVVGPAVEVINGGVDSYAPVLSRLQLMKLAPALSPDLVVLNFDMSDLLQEQAYRSLALRDSQGAIAAVPAPQSDDDAHWDTALGRLIDRNLFITRLLLQKVREWDIDPDRPTVADTVVASNFEVLRHTLAEDTADRERQWADLFESILAIQKYCHERGMTFLLTAYPWGHQVSDREWAVGRANFMPDDAVVSDRSIRRIEDSARIHGLHFANLFPAFRDYRGDEPLYFDIDMHWTPAGHRLVAGQLTQVTQPLIPLQR